jgi:GAF domain-containing protein
MGLVAWTPDASRAAALRFSLHNIDGTVRETGKEMDEEPSRTIGVLHVDDDRGVCDLSRTFLERADPVLSVTTATGANEALAQLESTAVDCIVSDYEMPEMDGLELLEAVREDHPDLPFVLFTGKGSEEIASEAIAAGVDAYLQKETGTDQYAVLAKEINNQVARFRAERRADQQARINDVVRKVNRRLVLAETRSEIEEGVTETVAGSSAYTFARVVREDPETDEVVSTASAGLPDEGALLDLGSEDDPADLGPTGRALRTGETEAVQDIDDLPLQEGHDVAEEYGVESLATVPLVYEGTTYGVLEVYADRHDAFDETEVTVLSELGDTIAAAIGSVETAEQLLARNRAVLALHDASQEMMTAGATEVAEIVSATARSILDLPINAVFLNDDGEETLAPAAYTDAAAAVFAEIPTLRPGEGIAWDVYSTADPKVYSDVSTVPGRYNPDTAVRSEMLLPMGDHGVFVAGSTGAGTFDSTDVSMAKLLVSNAEVAIERARREETIREREAQLRGKNERLEEFASIVSHDLRNPLSIAQGCTQLARTEPDEGHLDTVADSLDRMANLIDSLLALAREGHRIGDTETVDLAALVRTAWRTAGGEDVAGELAVEDGLGAIDADPASLQQLFENLFRNAFEYAGRDASVRVGSLDSGFYVADDGPGIPAGDREAVFESGFSTAEEGTGLGLKIVQRVVDAHGWEIGVKEAEDGGARFDVTGVTAVEEASGG